MQVMWFDFPVLARHGKSAQGLIARPPNRGDILKAELVMVAVIDSEQFYKTLRENGSERTPILNSAEASSG